MSIFEVYRAVNDKRKLQSTEVVSDIEDDKSSSNTSLIVKPRNLSLVSSKYNTKKINKRKRKGETFLTTIEQKPIQTRSIRYFSGTAAATSVTVSSLLNILLITTNASTAAFRLFEAVRIRSVSITILPDVSTNGVGFYTFSWDGQFAPHSEDSGIYTVGSAFRKTYKPPRDSLAWLWQSDDVPDLTQSLYTFDLGSQECTVVMDISFEYVIIDGSAVSVTLASNATVTGISASVISSATDDFTAVGLVSCIL